MNSAAAGVGATAAMSALLAARWALQRDVPPPPQVVTENTIRKLGIEPARCDRDDRTRAVDSFLSHVVFGWSLSRHFAR